MKNACILSPTNPILILSDNLAEQLPKRVIELRKAAGLTQVVVAERLGITEGRYGHYERGFRRFPVTILPKLAEALGCSQSDLIDSPATQPKKRGPASKLEKLTGRLAKLPPSKQKVVVEMLEAFLDKAS